MNLKYLPTASELANIKHNSKLFSVGVKSFVPMPKQFAWDAKENEQYLLIVSTNFFLNPIDPVKKINSEQSIVHVMHQKCMHQLQKKRLC